MFPGFLLKTGRRGENMVKFTRKAVDLASYPDLSHFPLPFFVLWLVFSIIHGSRKVATEHIPKNTKHERLGNV